MNPQLPAAELPVQEAPLYLKLVAWGMLAGMGGAVKFVSATLKSGDMMGGRRFLVLLSANVFVSGFSGLMGALAFSTLTADQTWQMIAAGVFGYAGTQVLDLLALAMQRRVGHSPVLSAVMPLPASIDPAAGERKA